MINMQIFKPGEHGRVILTIHLKPLHGTVMQRVRMKVDTGADFTALSKEVVYDLGYDYAWIEKNAITGEKYNMTTAAGDTESVGLIQLPLANILSYEAENWPFRIIISLLAPLVKKTEYFQRNAENEARK